MSEGCSVTRRGGEQHTRWKKNDRKTRGTTLGDVASPFVLVLQELPQLAASAMVALVAPVTTTALFPSKAEGSETG